jgi:chromosomal replication initiation ATPase DnaA
MTPLALRRSEPVAKAIVLVCERRGISPSRLLGAFQNAYLAEARAVCAFVLRWAGCGSFADIGRALKRDRTLASQGVDRVLADPVLFDEAVEVLWALGAGQVR